MGSHFTCAQFVEYNDPITVSHLRAPVASVCFFCWSGSNYQYSYVTWYRSEVYRTSKWSAEGENKVSPPELSFFLRILSQEIIECSRLSNQQMIQKLFLGRVRHHYPQLNGKVARCWIWWILSQERGHKEIELWIQAKKGIPFLLIIYDDIFFIDYSAQHLEMVLHKQNKPALLTRYYM